MLLTGAAISQHHALAPCLTPMLWGVLWERVNGSSFPLVWARQVTSWAYVLLQIDAFQHMQHFVQTMQQQAQHAIATEDQQHKQELHKLMAR